MEEEDEFLKSDLNMENVQRDLSDREGEKVQSDEEEGYEYGQLQ